MKMATNSFIGITNAINLYRINSQGRIVCCMLYYSNVPLLDLLWCEIVAYHRKHWLRCQHTMHYHMNNKPGIPDNEHSSTTNYRESVTNKQSENEIKSLGASGKLISCKPIYLSVIVLIAYRTFESMSSDEFLFTRLSCLLHRQYIMLCIYIENKRT